MLSLRRLAAVYLFCVLCTAAASGETVTISFTALTTSVYDPFNAFSGNAPGSFSGTFTYNSATAPYNQTATEADYTSSSTFSIQSTSGMAYANSANGFQIGVFNDYALDPANPANLVDEFLALGCSNSQPLGSAQNICWKFAAIGDTSAISGTGLTIPDANFQTVLFQLYSFDGGGGVSPFSINVLASIDHSDVAVEPSTVPEPATVTMLACGLIGIVVRRKRSIG
jgi:hypothetical protein